MEDNNMPDNSSKKSSKKGVIIISIVAFVIIAILGVIIWYLIIGAEEPEEKGGRGILVTPENVDEIMEQQEAEREVKPEDYYTTNMNSSWNFKSSTEPSENAYVKNDEDNPYAVYFDVVLTNENMSEEGRLVYTSPYIGVGEELTNFALDEELAPGDYNAILTYHIVDENDDYRDLNREVAVSITLHIQG